jgi:hypothetical protein
LNNFTYLLLAILFACLHITRSDSGVEELNIRLDTVISSTKDLHMEMLDDGNKALKAEIKIQTANACEDYIKECSLPTNRLIAHSEFNITSYTVSSALSDEQKNQLFAIFTDNMRDYYEQNWGWDKKMKW